MLNKLPIIQCKATIYNCRLRENLCQCIEALGGSPVVVGETVTIVVSDNIKKMVELFKQYPNHEIKSLR